MKKGIHPEYKQVTVTCNCGATHTVWSTTEIGRVDICGECHPFYTGKQKLVDSTGQVEKFKARTEAAKKLKDARKNEEEAAAA